MLTCALCAYTAAHAQQHQLHGVVSIQNSGFNNNGKVEYVPLAQVEDDYEMADPATTNSQGEFTLTYIGKEEKNEVSYTITKENLVVVNADRLKAVSGQNHKVSIYMCPPQQLAENKRNYYKIGKTNAEKKLEQKLNTARQELALMNEAVDANVNQIRQKNAHIQQLEAQKQQISKHARELAEKFAYENFDEASTLSQQAFRLFQQGDIDQALKILDIDRLGNDLQKAEEAIAKGENLIREGEKMKATGEQGKQLIVKDLMLGAQLAQLNYDYPKAEQYYQLAIKADSTNINNIWEAAYFLAKQNQHSKAIKLCEQCLALAQTEAERATFLNSLGILQSDKNELEQAEQSYLEALGIRRKLAEKNPDVYLPYVATTLNNLGILQSDKNELEQAEQSYTEALGIRRKLVDKNPDVYLPYVATTLKNLANLQKANWSRRNKAMSKPWEFIENSPRTTPMLIYLT